MTEKRNIFKDNEIYAFFADNRICQYADRGYFMESVKKCANKLLDSCDNFGTVVFDGIFHVAVALNDTGIFVSTYKDGVLDMDSTRLVGNVADNERASVKLRFDDNAINEFYHSWFMDKFFEADEFSSYIKGEAATISELNTSDFLPAGESGYSIYISSGVDGIVYLNPVAYGEVLEDAEFTISTGYDTEIPLLSEDCLDLTKFVETFELDDVGIDVNSLKTAICRRTNDAIIEMMMLGLPCECVLKEVQFNCSRDAYVVFVETKVEDGYVSVTAYPNVYGVECRALGIVLFKQRKTNLQG